jgi:hypothetical protein
MMKKPCYRLKICLIALVTLLACGCTKGEDQGVLFQDDFDNLRSGWGADQRDEFERGYEEGEYFIELHKPNWFIWTYPGEQFEDVSVEVEAHLASGSRDSHFGVLCRHANEDNFYYFAISADGYYAIFRRADGSDLEILNGDGSGMIPSPSIKTDEQTNQILAVCQGDELSLYVNGELLETVTDDTHEQGDVGLGAGDGAESDVRIQFDDFVVTQP